MQLLHYGTQLPDMYRICIITYGITFSYKSVHNMDEMQLNHIHLMWVKLACQTHIHK